MFSTALIVFREVLEAALIIGIIAASTRGLNGRNRWLALGIGTGLLGSAVVASLTGVIADLASGMGQELFNAIILGTAVLMLAWHNIWMASHGRELATKAQKLGRDVSEGKRELSVILVVVALAVLREGSETVLFLYGVSLGGQSTGFSMLMGAVGGLVAGIAIGYALYAGLLRIPVRWLFGVTGVLVLLLAAGMASRMAHFLIQADWLPSLATPLWDTSAFIPQNSVFGVLLHALIGYDDQPAGMQIVFYAVVAVAIAVGMKLVGNAPAPTRR